MVMHPSGIGFGVLVMLLNSRVQNHGFCQQVSQFHLGVQDAMEFFWKRTWQRLA